MRESAKHFYSRVRARLPDRLKGNITRALYGLGIKPSVNRKTKSSLEKGIVVFSFDFELSWAWRYAKNAANFLEIARRERKNVPRILELLDFHRIPATWATVGHLFLDSCRRENGAKPHPDIVRPGYFTNEVWRYESGDWYEHDPCSSLEKAPEWYAPDLIRKILEAITKHEIGCHTFSHIDFSDENCPPDLADSEIVKCIQLSREFGVKLESMVFPGRTYGNREVLKNRGFLCYRRQTAFDIDVPGIDEYGLVAIPESAMLDKDGSGWGKDFYIGAARKYFKAAVKHRSVCHFWCHPSMDEWYLDNVFPDILSLAAEEAADRRIEILTMRDLALLTVATRPGFNS